MVLVIDKLTAAESQLIEAVRLFFEERDAVSIHTLAFAALQILHDHFDKDAVRKHQLLFHYYYLEDKSINKEFREAASFFKHANRDIEAKLDFDPKISEFYIADAIRCLEKLKGVKYTQSIPELHAFDLWFYTQTCQQLKHLAPKNSELYEVFKNFTKKDFLGVIEKFRKHPEIVETMELEDEANY